MYSFVILSQSNGKPAHCERLKNLICQRVLWRAACSEDGVGIGVVSPGDRLDSWIPGVPGGRGGESERGISNRHCRGSSGGE